MDRRTDNGFGNRFGSTNDGQYIDPQRGQYNSRPDQSQHGFSSDFGDYTIRHETPTVYRTAPHPDHFRDIQGFSGRGPKNWQRSDERIMEEVCEMLTWHPEIDASEMEVSVENGVVLLRGHAESRRIKRVAEDMLERLPGVRDIRNELTVNEGIFQRARRALMETVDPTGTVERSAAGRVVARKNKAGDDNLGTPPGT